MHLILLELDALILLFSFYTSVVALFWVGKRMKKTMKRELNSNLPNRRKKILTKLRRRAGNGDKSFWKNINSSSKNMANLRLTIIQKVIYLPVILPFSC